MSRYAWADSINNSRNEGSLELAYSYVDGYGDLGGLRGIITGLLASEREALGIIHSELKYPIQPHGSSESRRASEVVQLFESLRIDPRKIPNRSSHVCNAVQRAAFEVSRGELEELDEVRSMDSGYNIYIKGQGSRPFMECPDISFLTLALYHNFVKDKHPHLDRLFQSRAYII